MLWLIPTFITLAMAYYARRDSRDIPAVALLIWAFYSIPALLGWLVYLVICAVS